MTAFRLVAVLALAQAVPAEPQRPGDPVRGYDALINGGYVRCGVPWSLYREGIGAAPRGERLPGRRGINALLPYYATATAGHAGVPVVAANCLSCHAGWIDGKLVIGKGEANLDQTIRVTPMGHLARFFTGGADEREMDHFLGVMDTVESPTVTDTVGISSADRLAALLMSHRDPVTLAWRSKASFEVSGHLAPVKVPAWWLMRRKTAMFFTGSGRGDHARLMMASALLCTDSVKEAEEIDRDFGDIRAYIASLRAPAYPYPVDAALAGQGAELYRQRCEKCHGSADPDGP
jgi:cytochrome c5